MLEQSVLSGDFTSAKMLCDNGASLTTERINFLINFINKEISYVETSPLFTVSRAETISAYKGIRGLLERCNDGLAAEEKTASK